MRTAVDTSVVLDVLSADRRFGERSRAALRSAYDGGALVACDVAWAEIRAFFGSNEAFEGALGVLGLRFEAVAPEAARLAGRLWRESRKRSTGVRERVIADFLIGAHAQIQAEALLTRDRGFYRSYFRGLRILDPTAD